jgi:hypothetical protein
MVVDMNKRGIAAALGLVVFSLVGCSNGSSSDPTAPPNDATTSPVADSFDPSITFQILNRNARGGMGFAILLNPGYSKTCQGIGPFDYMREGTAVTLAGPDGTTVALSRLSLGENTAPKNSPIACTYIVPFLDVPVFDFYTVSIEDRESVEVTEAELRDGLVVPLPPG